jgi:chromosome partitioning protein
MSTKIITVSAQKGGAGKSTISAHLAVEFMLSGNNVAILDLDRQGSLKFWHSQRPKEEPQVIHANFGEFDDYIEQAKDFGYDVVIVDTPPHAGAGVQAVTGKSDLVIVPLRPGPLDLAALEETTKYLKPENTLLVLSQVPAKGSEAQDTKDYLSDSYPQFQLSEAKIGLRKAYSTALIAGMSISEFDRPNSKAVNEIQTLFTEVTKLIN